MSFDIHDHVRKHVLSGQMGGFAQAIGEAWVIADSRNGRVLEEAFPHIFMPRERNPGDILIDLMVRRGVTIDLEKAQAFRHLCAEMVK